MKSTPASDVPADSARIAVPMRTVALGASALLAVAVALAGADDREDAEHPTATALGPGSEATCSATGAAARHAVEGEARAAAKMARYPFAPAQGVEALRLGEEAARCHEQAGDAASAAQARERANRWRARLERDYSDHRLRLARALRLDRSRDALAEAKALLALLPRHEGPYTAWLQSLVVELEQRASTAEAE